MASIDKIVAKMENNPAGIKFSNLCKVCDYYFGEARQTSGSHRVYKTPWQGDPFVNIQPKKGMGKPYQVKQLLAAIQKLESM
ncbi:toxin HicA [Acaryochloris sp. CCMEE 5410]|uniref:toxin HicA n=1 Tax=Acaryochloris sp. CCMEE 5410 TaxID=310037 RepID=UPI0002483DC5|nr:toxin HicA [Acaryochloris sp. CCMEE 5410]KAI9132501.1 toxin HicA [Acaryochloris sp. CCMEE 5410]